MKILLDNCVDWRAKRFILGCEVLHTKDLGWANLVNGRLIAAASEAGFAAMVTVDKKIKFEQNLERLPLTIIEVDLPDSRLPSLALVASQINESFALVNRFRFISIQRDGKISTVAERSP